MPASSGVRRDDDDHDDHDHDAYDDPIDRHEESRRASALETVSADQQAVATAQNTVAASREHLGKAPTDEEATPGTSSTAPASGSPGRVGPGRPGRPVGSQKMDPIDRDLEGVQFERVRNFLSL